MVRGIERVRQCMSAMVCVHRVDEEGRNGLHYVLQTILHLLDPLVSEFSASFVGKLIIVFVKKVTYEARMCRLVECVCRLVVCVCRLVECVCRLVVCVCVQAGGVCVCRLVECVCRLVVCVCAGWWSVCVQAGGVCVCRMVVS